MGVSFLTRTESGALKRMAGLTEPIRLAAKLPLLPFLIHPFRGRTTGTLSQTFIRGFAWSETEKDGGGDGSFTRDILRADQAEVEVKR